MAAFTGTLDKCKACDKTVYVMDLLTLEGNTYHKNCFRCSHCNGALVVLLFLLSFFLHCYYVSTVPWNSILKQISNYSSMDGVLYCKRHFEQLFKESVKSLHTGLFSLSLPWFCFRMFSHLSLLTSSNYISRKDREAEWSAGNELLVCMFLSSSI